MPEYQGVSMKDVVVESSLFKGFKFSTYDTSISPSHILRLSNILPVVSSDPKSRTGAEDKKALLQMYVAQRASNSNPKLTFHQDPCPWWKLCSVRPRRPEPPSCIWRPDYPFVNCYMII